MNEEILEYASRAFVDQSESGQAEVAADNTDQAGAEQVHASAEVAGGEANEQVSEQSDTADAAGVSGTTDAATEQTDTGATPIVDYWKQFEEVTGGLVKDEGSLNAILDKVKTFDQLRTEKDELEKNQFKPANSYIETLNKLVLDGASAEQQKAFIKLNEIGDLSTLDPVEAKVAKMVLMDKYSEEGARKIVNADFPLNDFDEDSDEYFILKEKLRVSALADVDQLKEYKKDLSVVNNPDKELQEQNRLAEIAKEAAYTERLNQEVPKIAGNFPEKFTFNLKVLDKDVPFNMTIKSDYPKDELIKNYFEETGEDITQESIKGAYEYVYANYLKDNIDSILQEHAKQLSSTLEEVYANKYENRSGLPSPANTVDRSKSTDAEYDNFIMSMVGGK